MRLRLLALLTVALAAAGAGVVLLTGGSTPQSATGSVHPPGWGATPKGFTLPAPRPTAVPTGEMFDTITLSTVPARPFALAGYTSGTWPTYLGLRAAYPAAHTISIAVNASHHAACLDVEPGDASPSQAGAWVRADIAAGFARPCIYSDLSNMPAVRASLAGIPRSRYLLWLAWYRFTPGLIAGYDGVQWTDRAFGRNLDESTVTLDFLRAAQPPYVAPKPPPVLPVCYTHRLPASTCAQVRARVAGQQLAAASSARALAATNRVLARNTCRTPYRRGVCIRKGHDARVFSQRVSYFTAAARKLEAAS